MSDTIRRKSFIVNAFFFFFLLLSFPVEYSFYGNLFRPGNESAASVFFLQWFEYFPFQLAGVSWTSNLLKLVCLLLASLILAILSFRKVLSKIPDYDQRYYWFRVLLRYRLAFALLGSGISLLFYFLIPNCSLSDYHTRYGYFVPWKIYYNSLSIASFGYIYVLGIIQIAVAVLLMNRRTTIIGVIVSAFLLTNVVLVNIAYQMGDILFSIYLLLIALILLSYDFYRLCRTFFSDDIVFPDTFKPFFDNSVVLYRKTIKVAVFIVVICFVSVSYVNYKTCQYPYAPLAGIKDAEGFYDVSKFVYNGREIPYSLTDSTRWQNVVFEKWNVLSVKTNQIPQINPSVYKVSGSLDKPRIYQYLGNGDRSFYTYRIKEDRITLTNANDTSQNYTLSILHPKENVFLLDGADNLGNRFNIELNKIDKKYLLRVGRRQPTTLY